MALDGVHVREPGEYVRPARAWDLMDYVQREGSYLAVGTFFHQPALRGFSDGQAVMVELVPEPRNRHDGRAVALDIDGARIGYLRAGAAWMWHDVVRSVNRAGLAIRLPGAIRYDGHDADDPYPPEVAVELPRFAWATIRDLAVALGFRDEHDAVMDAVSADLRPGMLAAAWDGLGEGAVAELRRCSGHAPSFTWVCDRRLDPVDRLPYWHAAFLREDLLAHRERARLMRMLKRLLRHDVRRRSQVEREQATAARKAKRREDALTAIALQAAGHNHAQIAAALDVPAPSVAALLAAGRQAAPDQAVDWNTREQVARLNRSAQALALQRAGWSRARIAERLECSMQSVKDMLADARFYENPGGDPARLALADRCAQMRTQGMVRDQILAALGSSRAAGLRAFRDSSALAMQT